MPKYSQNAKIFTCKVTCENTTRKDGKNRYQITFPKQIAEKKQKTFGFFLYEPSNNQITFNVSIHKGETEKIKCKECLNEVDPIFIKFNDTFVQIKGKYYCKKCNLTIFHFSDVEI